MCIEGPKHGAQIDVGFRRLEVLEPTASLGTLKSAREQGDKSEDSEGGMDEAQGANSIEYDGNIQRIFLSRASTEYGYLAVISDMRFTIFYIYEESFLGADKDLIFDCKYRFEDNIRSYGVINALDFNQDCTNFVTGTNMGWVCFWNLTDRKITDAHFIRNLQGSEPESVKMLRYVSDLNMVIIYSDST